MAKNNRRVKPMKTRGHMLINSMMKFKHMSRSGVYGWLAQQMNVTEEQAHFSVMNENMCEQAINIMRKEATRHQNLKRRMNYKKNRKDRGLIDKIILSR